MLDRIVPMISHDGVQVCKPCHFTIAYAGEMPDGDMSRLKAQLENVKELYFQTPPVRRPWDLIAYKRFLFLDEDSGIYQTGEYMPLIEFTWEEL